MQAYGGLSGGDRASFAGEVVARIVDVNLETLVAIGRTTNSQRVEIDLAVGVLGVVVIPNSGESWFIAKRAGSYVLTRRSKIQNQALSQVNRQPGDALLNVGQLRFSDKFGSVPRADRKIKESNTTRAVGSALAVEPDLVFPVFSGVTYAVRGVLFVSAASSGTMSVCLVPPAGSVLKARIKDSAATEGSIVSVSAASVTGAVSIEGICRVGSADGFLSLRWNTPVGSSSDTTLQSLSYLELEVA